MLKSWKSAPIDDGQSVSKATSFLKSVFRFKGPCWNCLTSWMVLKLPKISRYHSKNTFWKASNRIELKVNHGDLTNKHFRWLWQQTGLTSLTLPFSVLVALIGLIYEPISSSSWKCSDNLNGLRIVQFRKIEFPPPNEDARLDILKIHSRKMNLTRWGPMLSTNTKTNTISNTNSNSNTNTKTLIQNHQGYKPEEDRRADGWKLRRWSEGNLHWSRLVRDLVGKVYIFKYF